MIYIETKDQKFGLVVKLPDQTRELIELCIADRMARHIEKDYQTLGYGYDFSNSIDEIAKLDMQFQDCTIFSGSLKSEKTPAHAMLVMGVFNFFTDFGEITEGVLFIQEFTQFDAVTFKLNELGFVAIKTDNFNIYITD